MTVGLFIALMLEAGVEYLHHRELVHQARENIRRELEENDRSAQQDVTYLKESADRIKAGITTLRFLENHRDTRNQSFSFSVNFNDLHDAAWRTARDTGALGYMPLDEVQQYASLYGLQASVTEQAMHLMTRQAEAMAPIFAGTQDKDFDRMSNADFEDMIKAAGVNYADVYVLQQLLTELDQQYRQTLKH